MKGLAVAVFAALTCGACFFDRSGVDVRRRDAAIDAPARIDTGPIDAPTPCRPRSEGCNASDDDCDGNIDESAGCGCPVENRNGRSYLFCIARTWDEARAYCTTRGYDLTIVNDAEEDTFISSSNVVHNGAVDTWMGLEDTATNGTYVWVDGTTAWSGGVAQTYVNWRTGVPEDLDNEDCVHFDGPTGGQWADAVCTETLPFVCEGPQ